MGNLQDWQHSAMYAAFLLSGVVDLLGRGILKDTLPHGTEHVRHLSCPTDPLEMMMPPLHGQRVISCQLMQLLDNLAMYRREACFIR